MTVRFIVDAQLPPALARMLAEHGHESQNVVDLDFQAFGDSIIWDFALKHDAVLVTKDEDLPHRLHQSVRGPVVVWLRVGIVTRRGLLNWFSPLLSQIVELVGEENRLIELR